MDVDLYMVTDPFLRSVLNDSARARQQSLELQTLVNASAQQHEHEQKHDHDHDQAIDPAGTSETKETNANTQAQTASIARGRKQLYAQLALLRQQNRRALMAVRASKQATAEARGHVDTLHLQLQNQAYEQRHLRGEIWACESYDHKYQQLPLISVEEFLREQPELVDADADELMRARIAHELAAREGLEAERQARLKRKQALIAENKKRKDDLASLDQDLEKFIDAAKPIQTMFEKEY